MALASRSVRQSPKGHAKPRLAPPSPLRSGWREFRDLATNIGITLYPWQEIAARYLTATGPDGRWLYREVAIIVARQNGKTFLVLPLIVGRMLAGQRVMMAAQSLQIPRQIHDALAAIFTEHYPELVAKPRGIRYGAGYEEITLTTGGHFGIVAATPGSARGARNDLIIVDELREVEDHRFIQAAKPTIAASEHPQVVYLSNAGTEKSEALHALKARAGEDPALAYLEWSAAPERKADEFAGWLEANPSIGHKAGLLEGLTDEYRAAKLGGTLALFETEHLCRWVISVRAQFIDPEAWRMCEGETGDPKRAYLGLAMDPSGKRASAALAWRLPDDAIALRMLPEAVGDPIDTDLLGKDLRASLPKHNVMGVAYGPDDRELAKFFPKATEITGRNFANASGRLSLVVQSGKLRHQDADAVTDDLAWTTRKDHDESGSFQAIRADDDRPITAALAAIRAVWLASGPTPSKLRVF